MGSSNSNSKPSLPPIIPNLPDDIAARCISLVPVSSHPNLSLVSKSFHSLVRSPHLFHLRSSHPEPVLLLSIRVPSSPSLLFLLLHPTATSTASSPHPANRKPPILVPLPSPPIPTVGSSFCPLGPTLYLIGGSHSSLPIRKVQILDLRSRQWSPGPSMSSPREFLASAAISSRIFALGGCLPTTSSSSSSPWAESLQLHNQDDSFKWSPLSGPSAHLPDKWMHGSAVLDGKLVAVADRGGVVFDPETMTWGPVPKRLDMGWKGTAAVVAGVLFTYDYLGKIKGYDAAVDQWRKVEGLEKKLPVFLCGATLASFGGLLCLVWEERGERRVEKAGKEAWIPMWRSVVDISCAGIEILKEDGGGLRGKVVWLERGAFALPKGSIVVHCVEMEL